MTVAEDDAANSVSPKVAERVYSVVLNSDGEVDEAETDQSRERLYRERIENATPLTECFGDDVIGNTSRRD